MRPLVTIIVMITSLPASAEAKQAVRTIVSDIEMSEWTPPLQSTIDINNGEYFIKPPSTQWPSSRSKPGIRSGKIAAATLVRIRNAFAHALSIGVADHLCIALNGQGYDAIISNAGVAHMTLTEGARQIGTAANYAFWTPAAFALRKELEQIFNTENPL